MKNIFSNIIGILLVIIIVSGLLYSWSKNNVSVEKFEDPIPGASNLSTGFASVKNIDEMLKLLAHYLLEVRVYSKDLQKRINALRNQFEKKGYS